MLSPDLKLIQHQLEQENLQLELSIVVYLQQSPNSQDQLLLNKLRSVPTALWPEQLGTCYPTYLSDSKHRLEQLQAALSQLKLGTYGICADCEAEIEAELLQQDLAAQRCRACEKKAQARQPEL
jgi:DnaK suppressor protein